MPNIDAINEFQKIVNSNPQKYISEYSLLKEQVAKSPAKYKGEPIDFLYQPLPFSQQEVKDLDTLTQRLMTILNKVIKKVLR